MNLSEMTEKVIGAAIEIHRAPGTGLLESAYEERLCYELLKAGRATCQLQRVGPEEQHKADNEQFSNLSASLRLLAEASAQAGPCG